MKVYADTSVFGGVFDNLFYSQDSCETWFSNEIALRLLVLFP